MNQYIALQGYGSYGGEIEVEAKDIFSALKKVTDITKKRMLAKGFEEKDGADVSVRIWRQWL